MIKLAKVGKTNKKVFKIVISEKTKDPYGKALEILGSYNPYSKELKIKADRVKHWISQGSQMTESVNNLFVDNKIIEGKKVKNSRPGTPNKIKQAKIEKKSAAAKALIEEKEKAKTEAEEAKNTKEAETVKEEKAPEEPKAPEDKQ